ncbi:hypothetical protein SR1949_15990 [Sphaerospermopsis reniformis]|jgi:hypothetical protein|uniref:Uncharacterized protein n=1 Tax=Sphaerospermopsis reniformis TaxID=531300 RepID=A0A479ZV55_9CYAN|nr:hypothetical protein NIES73_05860 [Sphaerospermopsis kisseleviana NIES-73]GCL36495.1 hypothetical protein SR1949_15990 [Sphaerospermopsis reniformis]
MNKLSEIFMKCIVNEEAMKPYFQSPKEVTGKNQQ